MQDIIFQLEQAVYNHQQWYNAINRSLICRLPCDKHDINTNAHKECRFGQWYYEMSSKKLTDHSGFIALGEKHLQMHKLAAKILKDSQQNGVVSPIDYDHFANSLERMRLELAVLQRELSDLIYNRDPLTGAINRVYMLPILREQLTLSRRHVQLCCITMIEPEQSVEKSIDHADAALYKAKSEGRNCVRIWGKGNPETE